MAGNCDLLSVKILEVKGMGIRCETLANYGTVTRFPKIDTLIRISSELHMSVEYLLDLPGGGEKIDISNLQPNEASMIRMMVYMFRTGRDEKSRAIYLWLS